MKTISVLPDPAVLKIDEKRTYEKIKGFIRDQVDSSGTEGVVVGMSGGIDSSLTTALCVDALDSHQVLGLLMPTKVSLNEDMKDAQQLGHKLDILQEWIDIQSILKSFKEELGTREETDPVPVGNLIPRIRMTILYYYANSLNMLVAGTGNKSELLIGYFTKYGDGGADILPIGGLYKTQVRQLASFLHLPKQIISKKPSAGLWPGQTDEEEIGIDYETLDLILYGITDLGLTPKVVAEEMSLTKDTVNKVISLIKRNEHKRITPPWLQLSPDLYLLNRKVNRT